MNDPSTGPPPSPARLALQWGALWGVALGFALLAPSVVATRHFDVRAEWQWAVVAIYLAGLFGLLGGLLALFGCLPLAVAFRARPPRDPRRALALGALAVLPIAYCAVAWLCQEATPGPKNRISAHLATAHTMVAFSTVWAIGVAVIGARMGVLGPRLLARAAAAVAIAGALALPLHERGLPRDAPAPAATRLAPRRPLLFVALDGASWNTLQPLLDRGALPALGALAATGIRGEVHAIWPPYWSAPAWAAIVSGRSREETRIFEDLAEHPPFPMPEFQINLTSSFELDPVTLAELVASGAAGVRLGKPSRRALRGEPFWEIASRAGVHGAVIRMPFTDPAEGQAATIVSDAAGQDEWSLIRSLPRVGPGLAWPPERERALLAPFESEPAGVTLGDLLPDPGRPKPLDALEDPFRLIRISLRIDQQTLRSAEQILRDDPRIELLALYLGGLDEVGHAFFQYRFPEQFPGSPPAAADVAELGPMIDRYWQLLDGELGRLIARFPETPNVLLTADHGMEATHEIALWKGWHAPRGGVVLVAGPDVARVESRLPVAYADILPTVLDLLGVAAEPRPRGRSLLGG